jgi:two-component system sensor histidine kinase RegB
MILSADATTLILHRLRIAAVVGQVAVVAAATWIFAGALALAPMLAVIGAYAGWHFVVLPRTLRGRSLDDAMLAREITIDVAVITALLCMAGGWTNPFASIYLVPLGFAAAMLPLERVLGVAAAAFAGYLATIAFYVPLPELEPHHAGHGNLHLVGMWMSFLLASSVLVVTVAFVRRAHDAERRALAQERESRLRDEHVLSLGVLAASTVHEIGTPLATARLIADELVEAPAEVSSEEARQLCTQLDYAIGQLRRLAAIGEGDVEEALRAGDLLARIAARFRILRPDVELVESHGAMNDRVLICGPALESAVLSLLINGAQASARSERRRVDLAATVEGEALRVQIRDYGPGLSGERSASGGLGVGLVISSATLERYGAEARHYARDPGTEVVVTLPLLAEVP